jgi:hypothetical protein
VRGIRGRGFKSEERIGTGERIGRGRGRGEEEEEDEEEEEEEEEESWLCVK